MFSVQSSEEKRTNETTNEGTKEECSIIWKTDATAINVYKLDQANEGGSLSSSHDFDTNDQTYLIPNSSSDQATRKNLNVQLSSGTTKSINNLSTSSPYSSNQKFSQDKVKEEHTTSYIESDNEINFQNGPRERNTGLKSTNKRAESNLDEDCIQTPHKEDTIDKIALKKLVVSFLLCLIFFTAELVGGYMANSLAIQTDAVHLLSDVASFGVSLLAVWLAARKPTQGMSFGFHRAEVIGATLSGQGIWFFGAFLIYLASLRLLHPDSFDINAETMLITSCIGIGINVIMGLCLHQPGHSHNNTNKNTKPEEANVENQEVVAEEPKKRENMNVKAAFIHVAGDLIQSVLVGIAALIIYFLGPDYKIADPICTIIGSILSALISIPMLRRSINVLMEGTPSDMNYNLVRETIGAVPGVHTVHSLKIWCLTLDKVEVTSHIVVNPGFDHQTVLDEGMETMKVTYGVHDVSLQIENHKKGKCSEC